MGNKTSLPANEAIYYAAKKGSSTELESILRNVRPDSDPAQLLEWQDDHGRTALIVAAAKDNIRCVELLLRHKANVQHTSRRPEGGTALHEAVNRQCNKRIVDLLLRYGASPFVENISRLTALDYAIVRRDSGLVRRLEGFGYFSQYLQVQVLKAFGLTKGWANRWIAVVPRHGFPLNPHDHLIRRVLMVYHDARSYEPLCRLYLDGSMVMPVTGNTGETQALLALHPTHAQPKAIATNKDSNGRWIINFRTSNPNLASVQSFIEALNVHNNIQFNTAEPPRPDGTWQAGAGNHDHGHQVQSPTLYPPASAPPEMTVAVPEFREAEEIVSPVQESPDANTNPSAPPLPPEFSSDPQDFGNPDAPPEYTPLGMDSMEMQDDELCVICLDKPKSCGFVHGSSMHRCVCTDCAITIREHGDGLCPVCRQKIEHVITDVYG